MKEDFDLYPLVIWVGPTNIARPSFENHEDSYIVSISSLGPFYLEAPYSLEEAVGLPLLREAAHTYRYAGPSRVPCSPEFGMDTIDGGQELKWWEEAPHGVPPLRLGRAGQTASKVPLRRTGKRNS